MTGGDPRPRGSGSNLRRIAIGVLVVLIVTGVAAGIWGRSLLRASLPQLDGERVLAGLVAPVRIERDDRGVPVVRGESRLDVARATGFVHAQERFFQMDLMRRRAAGELAELFGEAALEADLEVRPFRLRLVARRAMDALSRDEGAALEAYAEGVNAGLQALGSRPFEYLLIGSEPRPWLVEDSGLCTLALYVTLQRGQIDRESALGLMHDRLPQEVVAFLAPLGTEWDAPLRGPAFSQPPVPGPGVLDLRQNPSQAVARASFRRSSPPFDPLGLDDPEADLVRGSNNWAVAGTHTANGAAILANDMHLGLGVPNIWYRAALVFPGADGDVRMAGVTIPGSPYLAAGSNGHVAWGFTNTQGDWVDVVELEMDPEDPEVYLTPDGPRALEHAEETVFVKGGEDRVIDVASTIWGPLLDEDHRGRRRALRWVALAEGGVNSAISTLENARDLDEALTLAASLGIPHQNFVCADDAGRIGWTVAGRIPRRIGWDGRRPGSWVDGTRRWEGWLPAAEYPRVVDPPSGRVWTANARVVDGQDLATIGFGGYALGSRARQIRDDLMSLDEAREADMLRVQLDDRALFLERWRELLLDVLDSGSADGHPLWSEARDYVEQWGGRASVDSVGYRLVAAFRNQVSNLVFEPFVAPCRQADPRFEDLIQATRQLEGPLWALVTERPPHLLDPRFQAWPELLLSAFDAVLAELAQEEGALADRTWGERNTVLIRHPLSFGAPALGRWLDMPPRALPGDAYMPRVQKRRSGASERLAVSPGREEQGYFHMPGGQSGHPLSPHYADGHDDWVRGKRARFLPGSAVNVLTLVPPS